MTPDLAFFAIRSLIRVGTAARDAYEQKVRDSNFKMPDLPFPVLTIGQRFQRYFNQTDGALKELTAPGRPLAKYWVGGRAVETPEATAALLSAMQEFKRQQAVTANTNSWIFLRLVDEEAMTGLLDQWDPKAKPMDPWARIALALGDVALDYLRSNPSLLGVGGNGEALVRIVCANLADCLGQAGEGPQAFFVERMGVAILQSGLKTLVENPNLVVTDKAAATLIGNVAKPLSDLFAAAGADPSQQLRWVTIRDTVLPQMVAAGLAALADHQKALLGAKFDPTDTLGFLTKGFLLALADEPVWTLGNAEAWIPIYQSLLRSVAKQPNLVVKGTTADERFFQSLISGIAKKLAEAPVPFRDNSVDSNAVLDLALVVIDEVQKELPSRTKDPWASVAAAAVAQVVDGLRSGGTPVSALGSAQLTGVLRAILRQAAACPGMIVGDGSSVEVQAIVTAVATAMAQDDKMLISADGWTRIAAAATAAAASNPGKLFGIKDATPESQLAGKLIARVLASASASFGVARASGAVLFGETLICAMEDTLRAAAGNARGAAQTIELITTLIERLNAMARDDGKPEGKKPIGAADWSWLFRNLIADVFDKGTFTYSDAQLRKMLYDNRLPGS